MKPTLPVIFIALLFTACDWMKPDIYASGLRTKRFVTKGFHLNPNDTIGILPPAVTVKTRVLLTPYYSNQTELREDLEGQERAKVYFTRAAEIYLGQVVKHKRIELPPESEKQYRNKLEAMIKVFEKDSVGSYPIDEEFFKILQSTGVKKFFVSEIYWEYYSYDLYVTARLARTKFATLPYSTIILGYDAIIDLASKSVTIYDSNILTPYNCQPTGYWGDNRNPNNKYPGVKVNWDGRRPDDKPRDQNKMANKQVQQIVKRFVRKGK